MNRQPVTHARNNLLYLLMIQSPPMGGDITVNLLEGQESDLPQFLKSKKKNKTEIFTVNKQQLVELNSRKSCRKSPPEDCGHSRLCASSTQAAFLPCARCISGPFWRLLFPRSRSPPFETHKSSALLPLVSLPGNYLQIYEAVKKQNRLDSSRLSAVACMDFLVNKEVDQLMVITD